MRWSKRRAVIENLIWQVIAVLTTVLVVYTIGRNLQGSYFGI